MQDTKEAEEDDEGRNTHSLTGAIVQSNNKVSQAMISYYLSWYSDKIQLGVLPQHILGSEVPGGVLNADNGIAVFRPAYFPLIVADSLRR